MKPRLRILLGADIAIGPGKADLLEAIGRTGSISAAAREMDMSYRRAWLLVDTMNHCFHAPLVEAVKGGTAAAARWSRLRAWMCWRAIGRWNSRRQQAYRSKCANLPACWRNDKLINGFLQRAVWRYCHSLYSLVYFECRYICLCISKGSAHEIYQPPVVHLRHVVGHSPHMPRRSPSQLRPI